MHIVAVDGLHSYSESAAAHVVSSPLLTPESVLAKDSGVSFYWTLFTVQFSI